VVGGICVCVCARVCVCVCACSFVSLYLCTGFHSFNQSLIRSLANSHSFTHSLSHSLTHFHPFTHSFSHSPTKNKLIHSYSNVVNPCTRTDYLLRATNNQLLHSIQNDPDEWTINLDNPSYPDAYSHPSSNRCPNQGTTVCL